MGKRTQHPIFNTLINLISRRLITALALFIGTGLLIVFTNLQSSDGFTIIPKSVYSDLIISLPPSSPLKSHPLPPTLAQWQDKTNSGDYFSQVTTTQVGYLVWSQFPISVYVEPPKAIGEKQAQAWVNCVLEGVHEWSTYLPLTVVEQPESANITIVRKAPPLQISPGSNIPRARSAQTTYELYTSNKVLSHRFTILLSPSQTGDYLIAAARHEFGHALGIWGHSPLQTDALYFSQVRQPSPISVRDVNTLKRVYEQPTSLGWSLVDNSAT
ncbi:peptidase [Nostoc sp. 'Lobaria pulmonaria (5183) cyanobiont']|uniref:peptidase n=1 Tax=Nostoc sp. 'Lobaria pulmonaria (5183) cyanobiont' TaxID=1618022 RepID=UPI000CF34B10|nr:peptidase [Nostoc sp. 'Lobaria pulmonaria (5183) cyanobiont']AVH70864.1 metallopeptidase [Nostoc sp. 'Lobaria pulmonaria (5183) cyanobiont']